MRSLNQILSAEYDQATQRDYDVLKKVRDETAVDLFQRFARILEPNIAREVLQAFWDEQR